MEPKGFRLFLLIANNTTERTMTMKRMMKIGVASLALLASATMLHADEAFNSLVKLANTPKEQITKSNAAQILDAAVATTNLPAVVRLIETKTVTYAQLFEKTKSNWLWFETLWRIGVKNASEAEKAAAFQNFVDTWLGLDEELQERWCWCFRGWAVQDFKNKVFMPLNEIEAACAKVASSSSKLKAEALAKMIYIYHRQHLGGNEALCEKYFDVVKDQILSREFKQSYSVFDFIVYVLAARSDEDLAKRLSNDIKWYVESPNWLAGIDKRFEPERSALRKQYLESYAKTDTWLTSIALAQDKVDGNKKTTESIYAKLVEPKNKVDVAIYLGDNDKLIEALITIDNSLDAETINKAIATISALDPDYRTADVLKALRVINKKYTLKLYDDRDTWEPVLSKVRALIDIYNN